MLAALSHLHGPAEPTRGSRLLQAPVLRGAGEAFNADRLNSPTTGTRFGWMRHERATRSCCS